MDCIIEMTKKDLMKYKDFGGYALDIRIEDIEGKYITVICHINTVPGNPEKWVQDLWDPLEQDGFIFGIRTQDDKRVHW